MPQENDLETLVNLVIKIAQEGYDGHFAVLGFTTGFKCALGTPDLDGGNGREQLQRIKAFQKLEDALIQAILHRDSF